MERRIARDRELYALQGKIDREKDRIKAQALNDNVDLVEINHCNGYEKWVARVRLINHMNNVADTSGEDGVLRIEALADVMALLYAGDVKESDRGSMLIAWAISMKDCE